MTNKKNNSKILTRATKGDHNMKEINNDDLDFMISNKETIMEKVAFVTDNKAIIVDNITIVGYELYKILASNKRLEELKEYKKVLNIINEKEALNTPDRDERYIISTILGFIDRVSTDLKEKEKARRILSTYNNYFEKNKEKIKVQYR